MNLIKYIIYSIDSKALNTEYDNYKLVIPLLWMVYNGMLNICHIRGNSIHVIY